MPSSSSAGERAMRNATWQGGKCKVEVRVDGVEVPRDL